jgi:hypothetical protein
MEIWKDIVGYEGLYQVSDMGRVRSLDRIVNGNGGSQLKKGKTLKQDVNMNGYSLVRLCKYGVAIGVSVHRLVALAFLPNDNTSLQVNHKDEVKANNNLDNLEWCTASYNTNYGSRNDIVARKLTNHPLKCKRVLQFDINMNLIKEYESTRECERQGFHQSSVQRCCVGKQKTHIGYLWKYKEVGILNG